MNEFLELYGHVVTVDWEIVEFPALGISTIYLLSIFVNYEEEKWLISAVQFEHLYCECIQSWPEVYLLILIISFF